MSDPARISVLIVDDEPRVLRGIELHLSDVFDLSIAHSGADALDILRSGRRIDVLVTDLMMPLMKGTELIARAAVVAPETVTILLTGSFNNELKGFPSLRRTLSKPCAPSMLADAIRAAAAAPPLGPSSARL